MPVRRPKKRKPLRCKKPKKRVVVGKGRKRRAVCRTPKRRPPQPKIAYTPVAPSHSPATPLPVPAPPAVQPHAEVPPPDVLPINPGFTVADAERLLWRAGFGPRPGEAAALAARGLDAAVASLVRPEETPRLIGPEPRDDDGQPLQRWHLWGHDHCWWLDRMVRSSFPLQERMTLVLHDWFATSRAKVDTNLMLRQNGLLRTHALGNFGTLTREITADAAMLVWLDSIGSTRWNPNENHARELMELFTLGANRGAYTETDVREAARAMTGWRATWTEGSGFHDFRVDANWHDTGTKTIFGQTGAFGWEDVVRLCLDHPQHPSWFVTKLWSSFVGERIDPQTQSSLEHLYTSSGREIAPVVEAILKHPRFYDGPAMVIPPVVHNAGLLRAVGRGIDTTAWRWLADSHGQVLFEPPNVAGWDESRWIDTSTWTGRWTTALYVLHPSNPDPWDATRPYDATESPETALDRALAHLGRPTLTPEVLAELRRFAQTALPTTLASWQQGPYRAMRQTALRMLIATSSDMNAR